MKKFLLVPLLIVFIFSYSDGQNIGNLLKKVKPGKKTESAESGGNQPGNTSSKPANNSDDKTATGQSGDEEYETIYTGDPNCKSNILYNESRLQMGNNGHKLVIKKVCSGKTSFVIVENGKQTASYDKLSDIPVPDGILTKSGEEHVTGTKVPEYIKESGNGKTVIVNGKNYGTYAEVKDVFVTPDKKTVFHNWMDMYGRSGISFNGKKTDLTPVDEMESFYDHHLIKSHDKNTLSFLCLGAPTGDGKVTLPAILVKPDGTKKTISINNISASGEKIFTVSEKNELCWLDTETWDLYTVGRKVGNFKKNPNVHPKDIAIIACSDLSKSLLYDRMGNLYFLNGHVEKAGAVYPFLTSANGKQYISWIKQSGENILKGSIELK